jgi:predicted TIM-barrel fold metal-dependent hydrolase
MLDPLAEAAIEPAQPIIDAHHHLYDREHLRYLLPEFTADLSSGHNIRATVFVQARSMYRMDGPARLRPVGETEFVRKIASEAAGDRRLNARLCDAIVGYADLMLGDAVREVLDAHLEAGDGHFRGIRHIVAWDSDASLLNPAYPTFPGMLASDRFRAGFAQLGRLGLSFDAWLFFHQLDDLADLARDFPDTRIILNHCGGILGIGGYAGQSQHVFDVWRASIIELARHPNVWVKIGGFGMKLAGFQSQPDFARTPSRELAHSWRPWAETCIEAFGAQRCMLESNFPADRTNLTYGKLWNAMKWLVADAGEEDKRDLFWRSAAKAYRLEDVLADLSTKRSAISQVSCARPVSEPGSGIG